MISRQKAFVTSDNQVFTTLEEAQKHELGVLFALELAEGKASIQNAVACVIANKDKFLSILATRKPRTPKAKTVRINRRPTVATTEGK